MSYILKYIYMQPAYAETGINKIRSGREKTSGSEAALSLNHPKRAIAK